MKPIEVISYSNIEGVTTPLKFRVIEHNDIPSIIKVEHVSFRSEDKLAGNKMLRFNCQSTINGILKIFELRFEPSTGRWFLYKI